MNYYERHLGDYARDTGHLSLLEHGAYTLLLDRYYATERGIPADQAHRLARARTKEEREAVDRVLQEFFVLGDDGLWTKPRVEREIAKATASIRAARENGRRGGRPRKPPEKPAGFPLGSVLQTQAKAHQTPDTIQIQEERAQSTSQGVARAPDGPPSDPPDEPPKPPGGVEHPGPASRAGSACVAMRQAGLASTNPSHPMLRELLDAGVGDAELADAAQAAAQQGKGFAWALARVAGQRRDAAMAVQGLHHGPLPEPTWAQDRRRAKRAADLLTGFAAPDAPRPSDDPNVIDLAAHVCRLA